MMEVEVLEITRHAHAAAGHHLSVIGQVSTPSGLVVNDLLEAERLDHHGLSAHGHG